jgi:hypothetical protein
MISVDQPLRLNHFKFYVQGKEDPLKSVQDSAQDSRDWYSDSLREQYQYQGRSSSPYKSSNIFFYKDLSHSLPGIEISNEGEVEFKKGEWKIPFRFTIPGDALGSYDGKDATILYEIVVIPGATFDLLHNGQEFTVVNPNDQGGINGKTVRFDGRPIISDSENQEHGKKVRLVIEGDRTNFSPGDTIRGRIILPSENSNNRKRPKIKKAGITLSAVECGNTLETHKQEIPWNEDDDGSVPFEVHIPDGARRKRNYVGKLTSYYWLLEVKLDSGWIHHLDANVVIQVE